MKDKKVKIAIICGILAVVLILLYLGGKNKSIRQKSSLTEVVIASKNIASGVRIEDDMVETKKIPAEFIQPGVLHSKKEVLGQLTLIPFAASEQILANKIAKTGTSITSAIPIGRRGVTISTDRVSGMAALIQPGDFVDVLATIEEGARTYTATVLQNVRIIAIGENFIRGEKKKSSFNEEIIGNLTDTVTLALSPSEAEVIAFAETKGKLKLVLRAVSDNEIVLTSPTSFSNVLRSAQQPKETKQTTSIEVIRGTKEEMVPIKK